MWVSNSKWTWKEIIWKFLGFHGLAQINPKFVQYLATYVGKSEFHIQTLDVVQTLES